MERCEDCKNIILDMTHDNQIKQFEYARCRKSKPPSRVATALETFDYCSLIRPADTCKNFEPKNIICDACEKPIEDPETIHVVGKDRICTPCYEDQGKAE